MDMNGYEIKSYISRRMNMGHGMGWHMGYGIGNL